MTVAGGVLLILTGIAVLGFGLFLFYAWLPLFDALVGFDIGILIGRSLTGDVGTLAVVSGDRRRGLAGAASYFL